MGIPRDRVSGTGRWSRAGWVLKKSTSCYHSAGHVIFNRDTYELTWKFMFTSDGDAVSDSGLPMETRHSKDRCHSKFIQWWMYDIATTKTDFQIPLKCCLNCCTLDASCWFTSFSTSCSSSRFLFESKPFFSISANTSSAVYNNQRGKICSTY